MSRLIKRRVPNSLVLGKSLVQQAELGDEVEIIIQKGAIFILPPVKSSGWKIWQSMGEDAEEGILHNPSESHDQYLYGAKK